MSPFIHSLAYIPGLASRPFFAALLIALMPHIPFIATRAPTLPAWFIHPITIVTLIPLAIMDSLSDKDVDVREIRTQIMSVLKIIVSFVTTFSIVDAESAALLGAFLGETNSISILRYIASILSLVWSTIMGIVAWIVGWILQSFRNVLADFDEDDDLGLQEALSWLEDLGVLGGIILATIFPVVALALFGLTILTLFALEKYFEHQEKKRQIACPYCKRGMHASALLCPHCRQQNPQPRQVGVFGQATKQHAADLAHHQQQLVARKRCPTCATKFEEKAIRQTCAACGTTTFSNAAAVDDYLQTLRGKLPQTAAITFGLSFIPFLGIIPAVIYYRFSLIASLRGYIPRTTGCLVRWGVRLFNLVLIALQPIPILGAVMLPLMALSNYFIYQAILTRERDRVFGTKRSQPPSGPVGSAVVEGT